MANVRKNTGVTKVGAKNPFGGVIKTNIVKGDTVMIRRGKDKARRGVVKSVFPREGTAIVEGLNMVKRHMKPGQGGAQAGGIVEKEVAIPLCALMLIDPKTDAPTRVRRVRQGERSERVAVRSGAVIPAPVKG
jgi:large subunit ribosomal protein L24